MSEHDNKIAFRQSNGGDQQSDPLTELARGGARRKLLADALEAEVQALLDQHRDEGHDGRGFCPGSSTEGSGQIGARHQIQFQFGSTLPQKQP